MIALKRVFICIHGSITLSIYFFLTLSIMTISFILFYTYIFVESNRTTNNNNKKWTFMSPKWEREKPCNAICCWLCIALNRNDIERSEWARDKVRVRRKQNLLDNLTFLTLTYIWDGMSLGPLLSSHSLAEHDRAQRQKKTLYSRNSSIIAAFDQTHQLCLHAFMWYVWTRLQRPVN